MASSEYSGEHYLQACKIWFCPNHTQTSLEISRMTEAEREHVWADLAGREETTTFKRKVVEDPQMVQEKRKELERELQRIPHPQKRAFQLAHEANPHYTQTVALKFLRASLFDAKLSAARIVQNFEFKLELFGERTLGRDIWLSDLDDEDLEMINSGRIQILARPDLGGRKILFSRPGPDMARQHLRGFWYMIMSLVEDEDTQKLGVLSVAYMLDRSDFWIGDLQLKFIRMLIRMADSLPIRFAARYALLPENHVSQHVTRFAAPLLSKFVRVRARTIYGTHQECMYALTSVGIPYKCMPVGADGSVLLANHRRWIEERRLKEPALVVEEDAAGVNVNVPLIKKRKVSHNHNPNEEDAPRFRLLGDDAV